MTVHNPAGATHSILRREVSMEADARHHGALRGAATGSSPWPPTARSPSARPSSSTPPSKVRKLYHDQVLAGFAGRRGRRLRPLQRASRASWTSTTATSSAPRWNSLRMAHRPRPAPPRGHAPRRRPGSTSSSSPAAARAHRPRRRPHRRGLGWPLRPGGRPRPPLRHTDLSCPSPSPKESLKLAGQDLHLHQRPASPPRRALDAEVPLSPQKAQRGQREGRRAG